MLQLGGSSSFRGNIAGPSASAAAAAAAAAVAGCVLSAVPAAPAAAASASAASASSVSPPAMEASWLAPPALLRRAWAALGCGPGLPARPSSDTREAASSPTDRGSRGETHSEPETEGALREARRERASGVSSPDRASPASEPRPRGALVGDSRRSDASAASMRRRREMMAAKVGRCAGSCAQHSRISARYSPSPLKGPVGSSSRGGTCKPGQARACAAVSGGGHVTH